MKLRLGVDVGGTFTDVVAIDAATRRLIASVKVPTTHDAPEGVAAGIVAGIERLLHEHAIDPAVVGFIAHSTTQATNAILEGDVANVGVIGIVDRLGALSRGQIRFPAIRLAPGVPFAPAFAFAAAGDSAAIERAGARFRRDGVQSVAVSQAFSVDRPGEERAVAQQMREAGFPVTAGHDVSSMYGLRARTRTAAINAAILPKMVRTAQMTADAVRAAAIAAPLMVMRSDGGVMDARDVERKPILTLLSGPAAGVAGALLHENVTDGIFIEVGGTSSDCSAIRAGMPQMRPGRVGGQRMLLRTLDVRTLPIAGGSMPRVGHGRLIDVGPRSAHIAGLKYASFVDPEALRDARATCMQPSPHDPSDYLCIVAADGSRIALTPTCAANALGLISESAFAYGNREAAQRAFALAGAWLEIDGDSLARAMLDVSSAKVIAAIEALVADYELDRDTIVAVGGGGGAAALVPYAAKKTGLDFRLAQNAEVISPIGVALALVRDVVERTVVDPTPADILRIRREAQDAVIAAGASPDSVDVAVEIDPQRNLVRATASGAGELAESSAHGEFDGARRREVAAQLFRADASSVREVAATPGLSVYERERHVARRFGRSRVVRDLRVVDRAGVGRLGLRDALVRLASAEIAESVLRAAIDESTAYGDVGRALPDLYLLHGARIANLSGLASAEQAVALGLEDLAGREPNAPVIVLAAPRLA